MKKVLFICYYFPPYGGGGVFRALKFVKYLPSFGWEPVVLTVAPKGLWAEDWSILEGISAEIIRTEAFHPTGVYRQIKDSESELPGAVMNILEKLLVGIPDKLLLPDNRLGWFPYAVSKAIQLHKKHHFDVVYTNSPPQSAHLTGASVKKLLRIPWIADFKDGWIYNPFRKSRGFPADELEKGMERRVCAGADAIVTVSAPLKEYFDKYGQGTAALIPNGFDEQDFEGLTPVDSTVFTIGYFGSLFGARSPDAFLEAAGRFMQEGGHDKSGFRIRFVGPVEKSISERMERYSHLPLEFIHYLPHKECLREMMSCDALLTIVDDSPMNMNVVTGKIFEYLRTGRPVLCLCPENGALWNIVSDEKLAFKARPGDIEKISALITRLYKLKTEKRNIIKREISYFERKALTSMLANVFDTCAV